MRLLCEIFVIGALIYLGWEKPFSDWLHSKPETPKVAPATRPLARVAPTPSSAWMRDPNRQTALDTPAAKPNYPQHSPSAPVRGCGTQIANHLWIDRHTTIPEHSRVTSRTSTKTVTPTGSMLAASSITNRNRAEPLHIFPIECDTSPEAPIRIRDDQKRGSRACFEI